MTPVSLSQYEAAARTVLEHGPGTGSSNRIDVAATLLRRESARQPDLDTAIIDCAGLSPKPSHLEVLRGVLAALDVR